MPTALHPSALADMTPCQTKAWDILQREGNVFLTGAAGTGKSWLLQRYLRDKAETDFPVVASTGAAAVLIGGRTFHSFFGLGIMEGGFETAVVRAVRSRKVQQRLQQACCIVIDEVSMLSGETLLAAEAVARRARGNDAPWGGLRIIAVGDFAQLPPISRNGMAKDWAFTHYCWDSSAFQPALLSTVVRTREPEFLQILNSIRAGEVTDQVTAFLNERTTTNPPEDCTRLYSHRAHAHTHNLHRLQQIDAPVHEFSTSYEGDARYIQTIKRSLPIPEILHLKRGALVMMRKNDPTPEPRWVNGSLGIVEGIRETELEIALLSGRRITVSAEKFSYLGGDGQEVAAAWNFPVSLSWATTIHKAQGASVDRIHVDLSQLWEPGQAYVALSRVRSAAGLTIHKWSPSSIRVDDGVTQFYNSLADAMETYVPRPLFVAPIVTAEEKAALKRKKPKTDRYAETKRMLDEQASIEDIAHFHRINYDRVPHHIEKLLKRNEPLDLSYLRDSIAEFYEISDAFERHSSKHLKPIYDALGGMVPYRVIHLARCILQWEARQGM